MNPQAFKILEFDPLRALVRQRAQTDLARARIAQIFPLDDFAELQRELRTSQRNDRVAPTRSASVV